MAENDRRDREGTRWIYVGAAALCLVAPALSPTEFNRVTLSFVLLAGVPMSTMALLLATIHAQQGLTGGLFRLTALAWIAGASLMLVPLEGWGRLAYRHSTVTWLRTVGVAFVAVLFAVLAVRACRRRSVKRVLLAVAFGAVALFFGYRAAGYWFAGGDGVESVESVAEALADFFVDAAVTCVLLLPVIGVHRFHAHPFTLTGELG